MPKLIAEAGVNHNGKMETAIRLIEKASEVGADVVKFQLFAAKRLGEPELEPLELSVDNMRVLRRYAEGEGLDFLCTAFSITDAQSLADIGLRWVKLSSRDFDNEDLIDFCCEHFDTVFLSTGNPKGGPRPLHAVLERCRAYPVIPFYCVSRYPVPFDEADLRTMLHFPIPFGYSDHTVGIIAPIVATVLGASYIEKHFTLDTRQQGPDHHMSATPATFGTMVDCIRDAEAMLA